MIITCSFWEDTEMYRVNYYELTDPAAGGNPCIIDGTRRAYHTQVVDWSTPLNLGEIDRWHGPCMHCGWQMFQHLHDIPQLLYRNGTEATTFEGLPAGAIVDANAVLNGMEEYYGPDGRSYVVFLPSGELWFLDGPDASGGPGWTRSGTPPELTATPAVFSDHWSGWLTAGELHQI